MTSLAQRSFATGELAPAYWPGTDREQYGRGVRLLRNFVVRRSGGAESRAGTAFKGGYLNGDPGGRIPSRIAAWQQSAALPYLLEFGSATSHRYLRFWLNGDRVRLDYTPVAWATATPFVAGEARVVATVNYYCLADHTSAAATQPGVGADWQTVWHQMEDDIVELPLPYTAAKLLDLQWADASPTTRFFTCGGYVMRELVRVSATQWSFQPTVYALADNVGVPTNVVALGDAGSNLANDARYQITAVIGVLESATSAIVQWSRLPGPIPHGNYTPITVTWDAVAGADEYRIYRSHFGRTFELVATIVSGTEFRDIGSAGLPVSTAAPSDGIVLATFNDAASYPSVIGVYQQRLLLSGQEGVPDAVFASRSATFRNFTLRRPMVDDDALSWRQATATLNRVTHIKEAGGRLFIFSDSAEGVVEGDSDQILRPNEVNPRTLSGNGAVKHLSPLLVNDTLLYVQARGSIVRDLVPENQSGFSGHDLTEYAAHFVDGKQVQAWAYQQTPHSVVWMVIDRQLRSLTYSREAGVLAWARHEFEDLNASVTTGSTPVLGVACVQEPIDFLGVAVGSEDAVYVLVVRQSGTFLERMSQRTRTGAAWTSASAGDDIETRALHVDSALTTFQGPFGGGNDLTARDMGSGTDRWRIDGIDHLVGQSVALVGILVIADQDRQVTLASPATALRVVETGGYIALTEAEYTTYANYIVGLPICCDCTTLDIDTVDGRTMKERGISISRLGAWVEESRSFYAGPDEPATRFALTDLARVTVDNVETLEALTVTEATGYCEGNLFGRFTKSGKVHIRHVEPTALTLLAIMPQGTVGG